MENKTYNLLMKRQSCRDFSDQEIDQKTRSALKGVYDNAAKLDDSIQTELHFLDGSDADGLGESVGYNGFRIPAPFYMVLLTEDKPHALENAGFIGQQLTLALTEMGLAACWQTINDADAASAAVHAGAGLKAGAVIAFGYRNKAKKGLRLDIKSPSSVKTVKPEGRTAPKVALEDFVFDTTYGNKADIEQIYPQLLDGLQAMALAQSFFNRAPYRVITDGSALALIGLKDELTNDSDMGLNFGITMYDFYAVNGEGRADAPNWTFEAPAADLKLPEDAYFVAKYKL